MKISNEPVTLSPEHSRYVRALAHASGVSGLDHLIEETFFSFPADNLMELMGNALEEGSPQELRISESSKMSSKAKWDWDAFVKIAEKMPAYQAINYQVETA